MGPIEPDDGEGPPVVPRERWPAGLARDIDAVNAAEARGEECWTEVSLEDL
jgi:hypothetical protein